MKWRRKVKIAHFRTCRAQQCPHESRVSFYAWCPLMRQDSANLWDRQTQKESQNNKSMRPTLSWRRSWIIVLMERSFRHWRTSVNQKGVFRINMCFWVLADPVSASMLDERFVTLWHWMSENALPSRAHWERVSRGTWEARGAWTRRNEKSGAGNLWEKKLMFFVYLNRLVYCFCFGSTFHPKQQNGSV